MTKVTKMNMNRKNKFLKNSGLTIAVFLAAVLFGFLALTVIYAMPTGRVQANVRISAEDLQEDGLYRQMVAGKETTKLDNFTDALMMLTASYGGDEGIIDKVVNNYETRLKDGDLIESCKVSGLDVEEGTTKRHAYARYWHGYVVILKPLLAFFELNEIRDLNLFLVMGMICATAVLLSKYGKGRFAVPYLLAVCFINPMAVAASLQFSTIFHTMSAALLVMLLLWKQKWFREYIWLYFMLVGMMTSYVDLLTYPVVALAFPVILYIILSEPEKLVDGAVRVVANSAFWCAGYVGMWASKWAVSSLLMQKNYFTKAVETVKLRSGDTAFEQELTAGQVLDAMFGFLKGSSFSLILIVVLVLTVLLILKKGICGQKINAAILLLAVCLYPVVWYVGTKNHSAIHGFYTYRGVSVVLFALPSALLMLTHHGRGRWWNRKKAMAKSVISGYDK